MRQAVCFTKKWNSPDLLVHFNKGVIIIILLSSLPLYYLPCLNLIKIQNLITVWSITVIFPTFFFFQSGLPKKKILSLNQLLSHINQIKHFNKKFVFSNKSAICYKIVFLFIEKKAKLQLLFFALHICEYYFHDN